MKVYYTFYPFFQLRFILSYYIQNIFSLIFLIYLLKGKIITF